MTDIQRDYEQRYHGMNSRWLAYCYAVDRHPTGGFVYRGHDSKRALTWVMNRVERAQFELGVTQRNRPERQAVTDQIWQYAMEERGEAA